MEDEEDVEMYGGATGQTSGVVRNHDGTWWTTGMRCDKRTNQLGWGNSENVGQNGDSGAPLYTEAPRGFSGWSIAGHHQASHGSLDPRENGWGMGTAAWHFYDKTDYEFYFGD